MWGLMVQSSQIRYRNPTIRTVDEVSNLVLWTAKDPDYALETGAKIVGFGLFVMFLAAMMKE